MEDQAKSILRTAPASAPKAAAVKVKRYRTKSGMTEHIPGLGYPLTTEMLQHPFVIKAIENFEARTGKQVFGTVVILD